jgi:hypothetical protein
MSSIAWAKIDIENKNIHKLDANIDSGKEIMNFVGDYISRYENFKEDSEIAKASYEHIIEFYNLSIQSHFEIIDTLFLKKPLDKEEIRYHICESIKIGEKSINVEQKNKLTENKRISAIFEKTKKDLISAYCFFSQLCQENDREDYARKYIKRAEKITEKLKDKNYKIGKKLIRCTKELDIDPNEIENKKERVWLSRNEKYQQKTDEEEKIMENLEEKNNKARGGDQGQNGYSVKNNRKKNKHIKKVKDV